MSSKRLHKNWLKAYIQHTRHSESPDVYHFWTGVSTIAGVLRRRVWIDERMFQWTPNFYIVLVGPPGIVAKSTTTGYGGSLLQQMKGIHWGPASMTWQALIDSFADAQELVQIDLNKDEYMPMACVTCNISELGTFLQPSDDSLVSVLIDLWDGKKGGWERRTRNSGKITIENPWINAIGCTTPAWLRKNFPEHMIGGGLVSRVIFVYGEEKRCYTPYPSQVIDKDRFEYEAEQLIHDLGVIDTLRGEYTLEPDALAWGSSWYERHWKGKDTQTEIKGERYGGYIARKQTHMHKLAMVLAAAQRDELVITKEDLMTAESFITSLEGSLRKIFDNIGAGASSRHTQAVINYVRAYNIIDSLELWRLCMNSMGTKEYEEALNGAIRAGYVTSMQEGGVLQLKATSVN